MSKKRGRAVEVGFEEVDEAVEQLQRALLNQERGVLDRLKARQGGCAQLSPPLPAFPAEQLSSPYLPLSP